MYLLKIQMMMKRMILHGKKNQISNFYFFFRYLSVYKAIELTKTGRKNENTELIKNETLDDILEFFKNKVIILSSFFSLASPKNFNVRCILCGRTHFTSAPAVFNRSCSRARASLVFGGNSMAMNIRISLQFCVLDFKFV